MALDLDAILTIAEAYEARKKALIERKVRQDQAYLATFAEGDSVKAFEALRPLVERVRELERMVDIMAEELSSVEIAPSICHGCKEQDMFGMYSCGGKDCIYFMVKQAAKEAMSD